MRRSLIAMSIFPTLFIPLLFATLSVASSNCYFPDGRSEPTLEYQPCDYSNSGTRMCCATNRENPSGGNESYGFTADICLQNGICMNQGYHADGVNWTVYWREGCTSDEWSTGGCLNACANSTVDGGNSTDNIIMTPCYDGATSDYWCCGDTTDCCTTSDAVLVSELFASSNQTNTSSSSGLSAGVKGAIGGGVAAGVLLVCAGILYFLRCHKGRKENPEYTKSEAKGLVELGDEVAQEIGSGNIRYEKSADPLSLRHEFESGNTIFERPADIHRY